jgi:hypothetical protein
MRCRFMDMTQNPKRYNAITLIHAKSLQALGEFQTTQCTKCFKFWCNHRAHCIKSQLPYYMGDNTDYNISVVVVMENSTQSVNYFTAQ